jgi:hypothetical protein
LPIPKLQHLSPTLFSGRPDRFTRFARFKVEEWDSDDLEHTGLLKIIAIDSFATEHKAERSLTSDPTKAL